MVRKTIKYPYLKTSSLYVRILYDEWTQRTVSGCNNSFLKSDLEILIVLGFDILNVLILK